MARCMHYLKAVEAAGTDDGRQGASPKMRELPINDFMTENGSSREDGRVDARHVPVPGEDAGRIEVAVGLLQACSRPSPADQAFRPLSEGECPLVKKG